MGAAQSELALKETSGYHVLGVLPDSPAAEANIQSYFDYIVAINGVQLQDRTSTALTDLLRQNINTPVKITIYNTRYDAFRDAVCVPSDNWGGVGLLGARVRFCSFDSSIEHVWRIFDVQKDSPAEAAGLEANVDWVIASPEALLHDQNAFRELISSHQKTPCRLYVYNDLSESIREVTVVPDANWGGAGSLGCDIGYGLYHRIPHRDPPTPMAPLSETPSLAPTKPSSPVQSDSVEATLVAPSAEPTPAVTPLQIAPTPIESAPAPESPHSPLQPVSSMDSALTARRELIADVNLA